MSHAEPIFKEKLYGDGVLIGNWFEEQEKFIPHDNSWRTLYNDEYLPHNVCQTRKDGELIRRRNWAQNDQSRFKINILDQTCRNVSSYDIDFNYHPNNSKNCLRRFSGILNAWLPEKINSPLEDCPQNWGLHSEKEKKWKDELYFWDSIYDTTYNDEYNRKIPEDAYKVMPKIRMDNQLKTACKQKLKEKFSISNQWMNFVTNGCNQKFHIPSSTRDLIFENEIDTCKPNNHLMIPENAISSKKYKVGPSCSEVIDNKSGSKCRDLTTYDRSFNKLPFCNIAKHNGDASLEFATKTTVGPHHDKCQHVSWHIPPVKPEFL